MQKNALSDIKSFCGFMRNWQLQKCFSCISGFLNMLTDTEYWDWLSRTLREVKTLYSKSGLRKSCQWYDSKGNDIANHMYINICTHNTVYRLWSGSTSHSYHESIKIFPNRMSSFREPQCHPRPNEKQPPAQHRFLSTRGPNHTKPNLLVVRKQKLHILAFLAGHYDEGTSFLKLSTTFECLCWPQTFMLPL